jgi:hypothetical protein
MIVPLANLKIEKLCKVLYKKTKLENEIKSKNKFSFLSFIFLKLKIVITK